jgi:hypothetical protein
MQGKPTLSEAEKERLMDTGILDTLLDSDAARPWSMAEIEREMESWEASDGVGRLVRAGLVHRVGDFVWASRAAIAARPLNA